MIYQLTEKGKLDKRSWAYKTFGAYPVRFWTGVIVLGTLAGIVFAITMFRLFKASPEPLISPLSDKEVVQDYKDTMYPKWMYEVAPQSVNGVPMWMQPSPQPCPTPDGKGLTWNDAIRQVFPKDEAGYMIRICMAENRGQNKYATNWNNNGSFDYSWCQINSVHKPASMTDYEWKAYLEDPTNHAKEVRRIYLSQGWNAWVVVKHNLI